MRIILLREIKGLGNKFDIKNVKDGYARNFLLPKGLAKIATDKSIKELETKKIARDKEEREIKAQLEVVAKDLANQEFRFTLKTGKKGEIFGSIGKDDIKTLIYADIDADLRGYLEDIEVNLERPIKKLGEHQVEINLNRGVKTNIKIIIESA
jgi:large subunit ribosomal protein L9